MILTTECKHLKTHRGYAGLLEICNDCGEAVK